jgi:hypothetical protein
LRPGERAQLEELAKGKGSLANRAAIILACASGKTNAQVAAEVGVSSSTAAKWRDRFLWRRIPALKEYETIGRVEASLHPRNQLISWDSARKAIAHDHDALVRRGIDPADPGAIASAAVDFSELEILPPGGDGTIDANAAVALFEAFAAASDPHELHAVVDEFGRDASIRERDGELIRLAELARRERDRVARVRHVSSDAPPRPYDPKRTFAIGDRIVHSTFGLGVVAEAAEKLVVAFSAGRRVLVHRPPQLRAQGAPELRSPPIDPAAVRHIPAVTTKDEPVMFGHLAKGDRSDDRED